MNKKQLAALDRVDAFLDSPAKWHQGNFSNTQDTAWCLLGACYECGAEDALPLIYRELAALYGDLKLIDWNDAEERTFNDVKQLIAHTRARLSKPQSRIEETSNA